MIEPLFDQLSPRPMEKKGILKADVGNSRRSSTRQRSREKKDGKTDKNTKESLATARGTGITATEESPEKGHSGKIPD